jgi:citrate lyase subunit alpha/citrate CoA-transferase
MSSRNAGGGSRRGSRARTAAVPRVVVKGRRKESPRRKVSRKQAGTAARKSTRRAASVAGARTRRSAATRTAPRRAHTSVPETRTAAKSNRKAATKSSVAVRTTGTRSGAGRRSDEKYGRRFAVNAAGRRVPLEVNGKLQVPFRGVDGFTPEGSNYVPPVRSCSDYPANGDKRVRDLATALQMCGLKDGMVVSTHHHLRNGDRVGMMLLETAAKLGVKDLLWFPSASFPCHAGAIELMESGVIHHIEGSLNGPLGDYCSQGKMRGLGVLRSHGGRWQAIQDGEVKVGIAVIAAPTADAFGNANGLYGPSACGSLGFALADAMFAKQVIVVTDHLVPFPCHPWQIQGNHVDYVVEVDSLGDPSQIVSGTTQITRSPDRLLIAEYVARFIRDAGILRQGFSFQAGAGGVALAFVGYIKEMMEEAGVKASFVRGGSTRYLVELLEEGLTDCILDGQTFDLDAVRSIASHPRHIPTSPFTSYNFHGKGNFASMVDVVVLGATEVDVGFNGNVNTHSDGRLLHGIGGWQNCLFAGCTILAVPSFRDRIPVIVDEVTTYTGPGELIDVVVTERGIAINPRREDLLAAVAESDLPIRPIEEIKVEVERICGGKPQRPRLTDEPVAVIKWVDGTVLDTVWRVE